MRLGTIHVLHARLIVLDRQPDPDPGRAFSIAWGMPPVEDTWEPIPGVTRAALLAKVASAEKAQIDASRKANAAKTVHGDARGHAILLHTLTVGYRTEGLAAYPRGSRNWIHFNSLPTTTPRRKRQSAGEGEGDGKPTAPTS